MMPALAVPYNLRFHDVVDRPPHDPPELIHRFPQQQQIAVSSQHVAEPRETAGGSSSKSSISWGIINGTRQDGV